MSTENLEPPEEFQSSDSLESKNHAVTNIKSSKQDQEEINTGEDCKDGDGSDPLMKNDDESESVEIRDKGDAENSMKKEAQVFKKPLIIPNLRNNVNLSMSPMKLSIDNPAGISSVSDLDNSDQDVSGTNSSVDGTGSDLMNQNISEETETTNTAETMQKTTVDADKELKVQEQLAENIEKVDKKVDGTDNKKCEEQNGSCEVSEVSLSDVESLDLNDGNWFI